MNQYILSTRLKMPQPRKNYLIRKSLFSRLAVMTDYKITLIKGGPGSGKTTLLSSYIKEHDDADYIWVSLDDSAVSPLIFWNYIIEAFSDYLGEAKDIYLNHFNNAYHTGETELLLTAMLNTIAEQYPPTGKPVALVMDDFHLIRDEKLIAELRFFITHLAEPFHIILLSRETPALYLSGYLMQDELLSIDEQQLKLSPAESFLFLKDTLKLSLCDQTLHYLAEKGEGWIGGLQLIAAACFDKSDQDVLSADLSNTYVRDYLTNEIYDRLGESERFFLVATSRLSYFSLELCEALFPGKDFSGMLNGLLDKNLPLQCLDEKEGLYRYHNILKDYLISHFIHLPDEIQRSIQQTAADAFLVRGEIEEGLQHLWSIRNYDAMTKQLTLLPLNVTTISFILRIPTSIAAANPEFLLLKLFAHYCSYDFSSCAEIHLVAAAGPAARLFSGVQLLYSDGPLELDFEIISDEDLQSFGLLPQTLSYAYLLKAALLYYRDRFLDSLAALDLCLTYMQGNAHPYLDFFNLSLRSQNYEELGYFQKSIEMHNQILAKLSGSKSLSLFYINHYISITGVYLKQMNVTDAKEMLDLCTDYVKNKSGQIAVAYEHNLAEYLCLSGQEEKGCSLIKHLLSLEVYKNLTVTAGLVKYLWLGDEMGAAMKEQYLQLYEQNPHLQPLNSKLLYARLINEKGQHQKALSVTDDILSYARREKACLKITEAALCKIELLLDKHPDGCRMIADLYQEAIYYACYDSIRSPFYFSRGAIARVQKLFGLRFTEKFSERELNFHNEILVYCAPGQTLLSEREREVLSSLAAGKTNKEIGSELYISLATVKTHILNIYRKLEVNSRLAAVDTARKLGLIK